MLCLFKLSYVTWGSTQRAPQSTIMTVVWFTNVWEIHAWLFLPPMCLLWLILSASLRFGANSGYTCFHMGGMTSLCWIGLKAILQIECWNPVGLAVWEVLSHYRETFDSNFQDLPDVADASGDVTSNLVEFISHFESLNTLFHLLIQDCKVFSVILKLTGIFSLLETELCEVHMTSQFLTSRVVWRSGDEFFQIQTTLFVPIGQLKN